MEDIRSQIKQRRNSYYDEIEKLLKQNKEIYIKISNILVDNTINHDRSEPDRKLQVGYGRISLLEYGFCLDKFEDKYLKLCDVEY